MLIFKDNFDQKVGYLKDFLPEVWTRNSLTKKNEKLIILDDFLRSLHTTSSIERTALQEAVGHGHPELQITLQQLNTRW